MFRPDPDIDLLTIKQLAPKLGMSESYLRKLVRQRLITSIKIGPRVIRFDREVIRSWLNSFFEISEGDKTNGANQETRVQGVVRPVSSEWEELDKVDRRDPSPAGRGKSSTATTLGGVTQTTAERFSKAENPDCQGAGLD